MNSIPLLSVPMITYNHENYIQKAIESALNQHTNFDYEIVIGEDCSTDNTRNIVFQYAKQYPDTIKLITSKKNVGGEKNARRTLRACQGKYIAFLDGDDYFFSPLKLQMQVDFLENNPDFGIIHSDYNEYIQKTGKFIKRAHYRARKRIPVGYVFEDLLIDNFIVTLTVCIRRELLKKYIDLDRVSRQNFLMGDYPIWLETAAHTKIGYINEALSTYRKLESSASHFPDPYQQVKFLCSVYKVKLYYIKKYGCSDLVKEIVINGYYTDLLKYAHRYRIPFLARLAFNDLKKYRSRFNKGGFERIAYFWGAQYQVIWFITKLYFKSKELVRKRSYSSDLLLKYRHFKEKNHKR